MGFRQFRRSHAHEKNMHIGFAVEMKIRIQYSMITVACEIHMAARWNTQQTGTAMYIVYPDRTNTTSYLCEPREGCRLCKSPAIESQSVDSWDVQ